MDSKRASSQPNAEYETFYWTNDLASPWNQLQEKSRCVWGEGRGEEVTVNEYRRLRNNAMHKTVWILI